MVLIALRWQSAGDDITISAIAENLRTRFIELWKDTGLLYPYVYQNYAYKTENVFAGYGSLSQARLKRIKDGFDPKGLFSTKMPGYLKIKLDY